MKHALLALLLVGLGAPSASAGEGETVPVPPNRARISLAWVQGFSFLDGGYADAASYYSYYWEPGRTWALHGSYEILPPLRAGLEACVREFEDRKHGIDDLHTGRLRLFIEGRLPLNLPTRFWMDADALPVLRGPMPFLRLSAGLGVIDPTHGYSGLYDRTFTWSVGVAAGMEYRLEEIGFFLEFGLDLLGQPKPSAGFKANPDPILSFPIAVGIRVYLP
jgi:hypothetical protein